MEASKTIEIGISVPAERLEEFKRIKEEGQAKIRKKQLKAKKKEEKEKRKELEKKRKKGIQKTEIGAPQNFRHLSHSGLDGNFEADNVPPEYKNLLKKLNVSKSDWKDPTKRQIIVDTVNQVINDAVETEGAESVDRDLMRIGSMPGPTSREPPLIVQPDSTFEPIPAYPTASTAPTPPRDFPPPPPSMLKPSPPSPPSPPPTPPPTPASSFSPESTIPLAAAAPIGTAIVAATATAQSEAEKKEEEEEKAEQQQSSSQLASLLGSVQLKKSAPLPPKSQTVTGRDGALEQIKTHKGIAALKHVDNVNDRSSVRSNALTTSGASSLEDTLIAKFESLRPKLEREGDDGDESSDWSSEED